MLKTLTAYVVFVALALTGCASRVPHSKVQDLPNAGEEIPPGQALVVFARTGKAPIGNRPYGPGQPFFIVDGASRFIGEVPADARLHVLVPAGEHTFVGWHHAVLGDYGQSSLVTGTLSAGKAYYVEIDAFEFPMQMISRPLAMSQRTYESNSWKWAAGAADCAPLEEVLRVKRVGPDPSPDPALHTPAKIRSQIEKARERYADRDEKGAALVWKFHERGGTFETWFVDRLREDFTTAFGTGGCARVAGAEFQKLTDADAKSWEKTYKQAGMKLRIRRER
jgi:hypothetical protein